MLSGHVDELFGRIVQAAKIGLNCGAFGSLVFSSVENRPDAVGTGLRRATVGPGAVSVRAMTCTASVESNIPLPLHEFKHKTQTVEVDHRY